MALDFNKRSFTKTVDQVAIDEGLRAYMLKVYNYMTVGLMLTGFIAYFFGKASTNVLKKILIFLIFLLQTLCSETTSTLIIFLI